MSRKLKTLDKILLVSFFLILSFGFVSGYAVNKMLARLLSERIENQVVSASELAGRTVATEMEVGNFRQAWQMIQLNVGKNNLTEFLLIDNNGKPIVSDIQSETKLFKFLREEGDFISINDHTSIKRLSKTGNFISEFKYTNLSGVKVLFLFEDTELSQVHFQIKAYTFSFVTLLVLFMGYLLFFFRLRLLKAIERVNLGLEAIIRGDNYHGEDSIFSEYLESKKTLENFAKDFKEAKVKLEDQVKIQIFGDLTRQVAHDIRSPLSALNMAMYGLSEINEEKRLLIRNAIQRINDISNDLILKSKQTNQQGNGVTAILLSTVLDSIISEKRIQYRDKIDVRIELDLNNSFGIFAMANTTELARSISNLINNSIEAFNDEIGEVRLSIESNEKYACIIIRDNGKGIPEEIVQKLGRPNVTYGKDSSSNSGSGLGVYHAKKTIEEWGGHFIINSTLGKGTEARIELLKALIPTWFAHSIKLIPGMTVVTVDDDLSIHQIWKGRLESIRAREFNISQRSFTSASEFLKFPIDDSMIFLVDFEFLNQKENGLFLIQDKQIESRSILVTSRYEEISIKEKCERNNIRLLPKQLSGFIPIKVSTENEVADCILIDNDKIVHMSWAMGAKNHSKKLKSYFSYEAFKEEASAFDKEIHIYIDIDLGDGIRGENVAEKVYALGFINISLVTGFEAKDISAPPFVKEVLGKGFPLK